jgi:hypothetical protein
MTKAIGSEGEKQTAPEADIFVEFKNVESI